MKRSFDFNWKPPRITNTLVASPRVIDRLTRNIEEEESKFPQFHGVKLEVGTWGDEDIGYLYDENGEMSIIIFEGLDD